MIFVNTLTECRSQIIPLDLTRSSFKMSADTEQRTFLFDLWEKLVNSQELSPMEKQVERIIGMHPEAHSVLSNRDIFENHEFGTDEPDPFAHIGLHSIIVEMISNDSPSGIRTIYDRWVSKTGDKHSVQHEIMSAVFDVLIASNDDDAEFDQDSRLLAILEKRQNLDSSD